MGDERTIFDVLNTLTDNTHFKPHDHQIQTMRKTKKEINPDKEDGTFETERTSTANIYTNLRLVTLKTAIKQPQQVKNPTYSFPHGNRFEFPYM